MLDSYYDELLPKALMCGMTPTQFWNEEPRLYYSYLTKHEMELDEYNYKAWLYNLYNYKVETVSLGSLFAKKGDILPTYYEEPIKELMSNYIPETKEEKSKTMDKKNREQVNYWAKLGKKGI